MRLARVRLPSGEAPAVELDGHWARIDALLPSLRTVNDALASRPALADAAAAADAAELLAGGNAVPLDRAVLGPPLDRPGKILAIGLNYLDHIKEVGARIPSAPVLFGKFPSSITGPYDDVVVDERLTTQADYEVELAVVIGYAARDVPVAEGFGAVGGYTVANDVSSRDNQHRESQWIRSKSFDGFCPLGPWITTSDEVPNPHELTLGTTVNGEERQWSSTSQLLFGVDELVAFLSQGTTLEPGDLILTGTPPGVAYGMPGQPWLVPGDVVRCEIEGLGHLENRVVGVAGETASPGFRWGAADSRAGR
ncbi:MAG: fumarylacetoacetate hydrolase family protein [Acidimicrobiales bacterium]